VSPVNERNPASGSTANSRPIARGIRGVVNDQFSTKERGIMAVKLNRKGLQHAKDLISAGKVVRDERDDWSEDAPSTEEENRFLDDHGFEEYSKWHLGVDDDRPDDTKGHYSFPFGDFSKVHRCGVISLESRAAQNDHDDIAKAGKQLLETIDKD
jgi:hypothetical protein